MSRRTLSWPFSIDVKAAALPRVAAALPSATPKMVPETPREDSASAAMTAPATEAATCFQLTNTSAGLQKPMSGDRRLPCSSAVLRGRRL
jgi:hypothetical protein